MLFPQSGTAVLSGSRCMLRYGVDHFLGPKKSGWWGFLADNTTQKHRFLGFSTTFRGMSLRPWDCCLFGLKRTLFLKLLRVTHGPLQVSSHRNYYCRCTHIAACLWAASFLVPLRYRFGILTSTAVYSLLPTARTILYLVHIITWYMHTYLRLRSTSSI